ETVAAIVGPHAKATSTRTESGFSGNGYDLREDAVHGVGVDKGNLQPEETGPRRGIDQLDAGGHEAGQGDARILDLVSDVVHARASPGEEATDGRIFAERGEQLDPARADQHRGSLDALV